MTVAGYALPAKLEPVGKALAVGAVALATEACLSRLSRRAERGRPSPPSVVRGVKPPRPGVSSVGAWRRCWLCWTRGDSRGRVFERRAVRWFVATETPGRRG